MVEELRCFRSHFENNISKVLHETLSKTKHVDEKLTWDGEENEDIFQTHCHKPF
jgi:hypothetical protein